MEFSPTKDLRQKFKELSLNTPGTTTVLPTMKDGTLFKSGAVFDQENAYIGSTLHETNRTCHDNNNTVLHKVGASDGEEAQWLQVKNAMSAKAQERVVSSVDCAEASPPESEHSIEKEYYDEINIDNNSTWEQIKREYMCDETPSKSNTSIEPSVYQLPDYSFEDKDMLRGLSNPSTHTHKVMSFPSTRPFILHEDSPMPKPVLITRPKLLNLEQSPQKKPVEIKLITPLDEGMIYENGKWVYPGAKATQPKLQPGRYNLEISDDEGDHNHSEGVSAFDPGYVTNVSSLDVSYSQSQRRLISALNDAVPAGSDWDRVTKVNLSNSNIVTLKGLESFLPSLKELDLSSNRITTLDGLPPTLQSLSLANNKITEQVLNLEKFQNLHTLDLSNNEITNIHQFQSLTNLRKLILNGNKIKVLANLPVVQYLDVSNNSIRGSIDLSLYDFHDLITCDLSRNKITALTNVNLNQLRCLKLSDIHNLSELQIAPPLPNLKRLELMGCDKLTKLECRTKMSNLRLLTMSSSTVVSGNFPHLESLTIQGEKSLRRLLDPGFIINKHLLELGIIEGCLSMDDLPRIKTLFSHIQVFNLRGNAIDGSFEELVKFFQSYKDIHQLNLDDNPIKENIKDQELFGLFNLMIYKLTHK